MVSGRYLAAEQLAGGRCFAEGQLNVGRFYNTVSFGKDKRIPSTGPYLVGYGSALVIDWVWQL